MNQKTLEALEKQQEKFMETMVNGQQQQEDRTKIIEKFDTQKVMIDKSSMCQLVSSAVKASDV